ncbi:MAG: AAA family ATPase, partial [Chloroflexi bacterium]|nr:AAA family ATPase [Chloroflexota bacterium]
MQRRITDDLQAMLDVLPEEVRQALVAADRFDDLLEVILDLGRVPTARYVDGEVVLMEREVAAQDIATVVDRIGEFDADNRAGMERT